MQWFQAFLLNIYNETATMYKNYLLIFLVLFLNFHIGHNKLIDVQCPSICKCDLFENYRRATCQNRNFVNFPASISNLTELLDLAFNQISQLDNNLFLDYHLFELKLLNLSYNKISQIGLNAFDGLNKLKTLDLSHNAMQYITINWFWSLHSLEELYLGKNGFSTLEEGPIIESKSLKILDLSACGLNAISPDSFIKLPNLRKIDLSSNYIQQIDMATITPLKHLEIFEIKNNTMMICNTYTQQLADYCTTNGIRFENPCKITLLNFTQMERMRSMLEPVDEKNSWIYDDENIRNGNECDESKLKPLSSNINNETNSKDLNEGNLRKADIFEKLLNIAPHLSILVTGIFALFIGFVAGWICGRSRRRRVSKRRNKQSKRIGEPIQLRSSRIWKGNRNEFASDGAYLVDNVDIDGCGTTPVAQRKYFNNI